MNALPLAIPSNAPRVRGVSKRREMGAVQPTPGETVIDCDRSNPVLGITTLKPAPRSSPLTSATLKPTSPEMAHEPSHRQDRRPHPPRGTHRASLLVCAPRMSLRHLFRRDQNTAYDLKTWGRERAASHSSVLVQRPPLPST